MPTTTPPVQHWLDLLQHAQPAQYALVSALRRQILALAPDISEQVKYGGLLFGHPQPFCGLFAYRQHVSLEFGQGARLEDAAGLLQGSGKQRRHLKLQQLADLDTLAVQAYLQAAYRLPPA